jgi:hypothetical protein
MTTAAAQTIGIQVSDMTGQKLFRAPAVPVDASIGQMVRTLLEKLGLPATDSAGRPLAFRARLTREARFLNGSDRVGDVLEPDDHLTLSPNIQAGGR